MKPAFRGWKFFLLFACACCVLAQSKSPQDLATGKLLVAPRDAPDPAFAESVILLVRYDESGVVGLMVNRPTKVSISTALKELKGAGNHPDPVFVGGPVELDTVLAITRGPKKPADAADISGGLSLIASKAGLEKALRGATDPAALRIYLGYCGWTRPQLEQEVRLGGWYVFDRSEALVFDKEPATLWSRLIGKTELEIVRLGLTLPGMPRRRE